MIYDSYVWKRELKKELNRFRKFVAKLDLSEESVITEDIHLKIEKFFFVSAFIIRKLNEAKKLSDELNAISIAVVQFERISKEFKIDFSSNHRVAEFYNVENGTDASLGLAFLCNILIHSLVFEVATSEEVVQGKGKIAGVLVNSDRSKDKALYYIKIEDFYQIVEETINDYIVYTYHNRTSGKIINSRVEPPNKLQQVLEQSKQGG